MRIPLMAAALACLATVAAAQHAPPNKAPAHQRAAAAAAPAIPDARIEKDIRARFARSKINADGFTVHVQGGVATLEGHTDVVQHKGVATRLAKSAGAVAVNNRIQPSEAARQKSAASLSKGRRRAQISRGEPRSTQAAVRQGR